MVIWQPFFSPCVPFGLAKPVFKLPVCHFRRSACLMFVCGFVSCYFEFSLLSCPLLLVCLFKFFGFVNYLSYFWVNKTPFFKIKHLCPLCLTAWSLTRTKSQLRYLNVLKKMFILNCKFRFFCMINKCCCNERNLFLKRNYGRN